MAGTGLVVLATGATSVEGVPRVLGLDEALIMTTTFVVDAAIWTKIKCNKHNFLIEKIYVV